MAGYSKRSHGYRSAAEIRKVKRGNLILALIATLAIGFQVYLLCGYFRIRSQRIELSSRYSAAETNLKLFKTEKSDAQAELDTLLTEIEGLRTRLSELQTDQ